MAARSPGRVGRAGVDPCARGGVLWRRCLRRRAAGRSGRALLRASL